MNSPFPTPENVVDADTLALVERRRTELKAGCPRHPDTELLFWKELLIGAEGDMNLAVTAIYSCDDMLHTHLDTEAEPKYKPSPF
ncbi:hypothetical protein AB0M39_35105 [Streptomyces sp. NPDC051907]|uniref:hypothetical protein n=1 Tax=Streptomyces sp. NPDC051907 TaxID=3155284 RepID=UPI00342361D9